MTTISVVLADDHVGVRASIRKLLESASDIEIVGEANNGIEAVRLVQELAPAVLVLDMEMPYMTGVEVAQQLQLAKSPVRVLALSTYDDGSYIKSLLETGAVGYLTKAEAPRLLVEAVRAVAQGDRNWLNRQAAQQMSA